MIYKEEQRDLFEVPQGYYLAHCISADFALGAGIALEFNRRYNMRQRLTDVFADMEITYGMMREDLVGTCLAVGNVCNLITKRKAFQKPTYNSLQDSLDDMKAFVVSNHVDRIAMPKIGCGLDRLKWDIVSQMIQDTFDDTDIEILVCLWD